MFKRSFTLFLSLLLMAVFAKAALGQGSPFIDITSPANGTVISDVNAALAVTVTFGNAPEGATGLLLRAYDANGTVLAQDQSNVSLIPWNAVLNFGNPPVTPGTTGYLEAYMIDGNTGDRIATSAPINVTYGTAQVPTATFTPTATVTNPPPTATFTPTATQPSGQPQITITTPVNGAQVDPNAGVVVVGTVANMPAGGATIIVRLRNANGDTLGNQGLVPDPNQPNQNFSANVGRDTPNVPVTNGGSVVAFLIVNNTVIATSNSVSLIFPGGPPRTATLQISSPTNGTTLNRNQAIVISGTSTGLPAGTVIQVRGFVGNTIVAQGSGQTSGNGNWNATIQFVSAVNPGAAGTLSAFTVVNNVQVNSNNVSVFWGSGTNQQPFIQINSPQNGAVVGGNGVLINVMGIAGNLFENALTVRALDTFGNILAQQPLVYDQNGYWQTTNLFVNNVAPGTPGTIYAFATSARDGSIIASARVSVTYAGQCFIRTDWPIYVVQAGDTLLRIAQRIGSTVTELAYANCIPNANIVYVGQQLRVPRLPVATPAPTQIPPATLRILTPVEGAQLDTSQRIMVAGAGRNLAGNNVIVRALDASGNLLAQQITTAGPAGVNGESVWQVSLGLDVTALTRGSLYAFAQAPASGQILADALVNVTFGTDVIVVPPPSRQQLVITQPSSDAAVSPSGQLQVAGTVMGEYEGDITVRILDNQSNVIAEAQAQVGQPDANGSANWQALININVTPGTRGTIYAYIAAPFSAEPLIADAVNVVFGQADNGPYVTITNPLPYSTLDATTPMQVMGRGGRLFEGSVTVRALDSDGNILTEQSTIVNSPNAGTGGEGDWLVALQVNVPAGTRGSIIAFSTSAQDGSIAALASSTVTFGDATASANFIQINAPLPGTLVDPSQTLMIAGIADRASNSQVTVQILDDRGNVLVEQPRNLNPSALGNFGIWQMVVELRSMSAGTHLRITALTTSANGTTLDSDSVDIIVGEASQ